MTGTLARKPPADVLKALRSEVGFHCPAPTREGICGSPYLSWHHFDPPWRTENHHRVEGMIALCREHADKADSGAYTDDQLRRFKQRGAESAASIRGEFGWMRNNLVARVGGNFYVDTPILVAITGMPLIWFERNKYGELMLNYRLRAGAVITNNSWELPPDQLDQVICKPGGRSLDIRHKNGDRFAITFAEHADRESFRRTYPGIISTAIPLSARRFPVTVVDVTSVSSEGSFQLNSGWTSLPDGRKLQGHWFFGRKVGLELALHSAPSGLGSDHLESLAVVREAVNRSYLSR